jgi:TIR domain
MAATNRTAKSPRPARPTAFISHASADAKFVQSLDRALQADKIKTWVDSADIHYGALLRHQLTTSIQASTVVVLVWSKAAANSRWVMAEMFTAYYLGRFIIPCVLDDTAVPQFLANAVFLDRRREKARLPQALCQAVRSAPPKANEVAAVIVGPTPGVQAMVKDVGLAQYGALAALGDRKRAAVLNRQAKAGLSRLQKVARLQPQVMNLAGYQLKNEYMQKHWDEIQAGRAPKDALLDRAERAFFNTLSVNPNDESAINGLGNILFFERDLEAAEFFHRCAIERCRKRTGLAYPAAQHDLDMVLRFKQKS